MAEEVKINVSQETSAVNLNENNILSDVSTSSTWKKFSSLHVTLRNVLYGSRTLHPEHVDVRNESYYYANRKNLKSKRLMNFITKVGLLLDIAVSIISYD